MSVTAWEAAKNVSEKDSGLCSSATKPGKKECQERHFPESAAHQYPLNLAALDWPVGGQEFPNYHGNRPTYLEPR